MNCFTTTDVEEKDFTDRRISVNQYSNILSQILLYFSKRINTSWWTFANSMHVCILIKSVCPKIYSKSYLFHVLSDIKDKIKDSIYQDIAPITKKSLVHYYFYRLKIIY